jgi:uncharacterized phage protein (TIGR02216 family)
MSAGLGLLGLPPPVFWAMTPRELGAALRGRLGITAVVASPGREDLRNLMQRYPDQQ